ncbi:MAG TPA: hypothetical protein PKD54_15480, partial [Pirellulaceae bacterium]|nr:hypothetical protein [Pirellulaceae bacterium]
AWRGDSILFIRVNQLRSFAPLCASVTAVLVDVNESVVVFAVDGHWDVSDPDIRAGFEHFLKNRTHGQAPSQEKLRERSPNQLFAYIAHQITCAWSEAYARPGLGNDTFNRSEGGKE